MYVMCATHLSVVHDLILLYLWFTIEAEVGTVRLSICSEYNYCRSLLTD